MVDPNDETLSFSALVILQHKWSPTLCYNNSTTHSNINTFNISNLFHNKSL